VGCRRYVGRVDLLELFKKGKNVAELLGVSFRLRLGKLKVSKRCDSLDIAST
jgi:hypothetical protein